MTQEYLGRLESPLMDHYKSVYAGSKRWDGIESLQDKTVCVYCEQGIGDIIQFARYFHALKEKGCKLILHCPKSLHRLFKQFTDKLLDKDLCEALPDHDLHVLSMSLPFNLGLTNEQFNAEPYLSVPDTANLDEYDKCFKIGIAWEGNPDHSNNYERCCPLEYFAQFADDPNIKLFILQDKMHNPTLLKNCERLDLYGIPLNDFWDTATLINAMNVVITVDTSVLHLAGAMNKKIFGLISYRHDPRWNVTNWYPSVKMIKQTSPEDWDSVFEEVFKHMRIYGGKRKQINQPPDRSAILFTGGIGDILALECFISCDDRQMLQTIYYATQAEKVMSDIFAALKVEYPNLTKQESLWNDYSDNFVFHLKPECSQAIDKLPADWPQTTDFSIAHIFEKIEAGTYHYNYSSVLRHTVADVSKFDLPKPYMVISPASILYHGAIDRNFTKEEWKRTLAYLKENELHGVILNQTQCYIPKSDLLVDLTNKTTLLESIELLKLSHGYIGIDSCLSVLAAKQFNTNIFVKSTNSHLEKWKHIYYAPRTKFDFIGPVVKLDLLSAKL